MKSFRVPLIALLLCLVPVIALAEPTHPLEVIDSTKALIGDIAYYLKYLLPGIALVYASYGGLQRVMAGDDESKKARADRTLTNAKMGLVIGLVAAPLLAWLQSYYK